MLTVSSITQQGNNQYINEVDRLNNEVQALRQQLRHTQRLASVGTMTSMVVHEFNNLLTPIISYAQMAQDDPNLTPKALSRALTSGQRAADICQAILGMARDDQTGPSVISLRELVVDTLTAMAREPQRDGIELNINIPEDLTIKVRRVELQQVVLNLLINARWAVLEASVDKPRIVISACETDDSIFIDVTDNGVGIDRRQREHIFQPFYTTHGEEGEDGNGLGLPLCRDILSTMNGWITVESMPGLGSTFTIRLPH
jgi:two-component system NtrC family sensor kinase